MREGELDVLRDWEGIGVTTGFLLSSFPEGRTDRSGVWLVADFDGVWVALDGDSTFSLGVFTLEGAEGLTVRLDLAVLVACASNTREGLASVALPRLSLTSGLYIFTEFLLIAARPGALLECIWYTGTTFRVARSTSLRCGPPT